LTEPLGEKKKRDDASEVGMERSGMSRSKEERIGLIMVLHQSGGGEDKKRLSRGCGEGETEV
jgi:hypothetical protein